MWSRLLWSLALGLAALVLGVLLMGLLWQVIDPASTPTRAPTFDDDRGDDPIVQVEVRNGAGHAGLAGTMTTFLRQRGFDVVASGNWTSFDVAETRVIDRAGNPAAAARVARALGISEDVVVENIDRRLFVDVTVVIGHDYDLLPPFHHQTAR